MRWRARTIVQHYGALWASRPQLKRDPLGRPIIVQRVFWLLPTLRRFIRLEPRTRFRSGVGLPVSRLVPMVVILLAPCVAGCPMPISHTETVSPPIVGIVRGPDDRPVRDVAVAVTAGSGSTCTEPALRDSTDAAGRFRLPAAKKTYHVFWVIPNFDRAMPAYSLCVGTGDTLLPAYEGLGAIQGDAPLDSITCVPWSWRNSLRAACSGNIERSLVSGGRSIDGEEAGRYRIILMREDSMPPARGLGRRVLNGPPRPHRYFVVVVQWLEQPDPDGPATVRTVAELPLRKDVEWAGELSLGGVFGRWCASVATTRLTHTLYWENHKREVITFMLGPPGKARQVPAC